MKQLTKEQNKIHFKAVRTWLPAKLKKKAKIGNRYLIFTDGCTVRIEREWFSDSPYFMKVKFDWEYKERIKCFRMHKDGEFGYRKVAEHIAEVLSDYAAIKKRRKSGVKTAEQRINLLEEAFRSNTLLSALNLEISSDPTYQTETGSVDVSVSSGALPSDAPDDCLSVDVAFDGQWFTGDISFEGVSMEQFVALMVVLRAGQLNLLEMLTLADDSILGPIIHKLTEDQGGKTNHGK